MSPRPKRVRQPRRDDDTTLPDVQATVTVTPTTVAKVAKGEVKRRRKAASAPQGAAGPVVVTKPHPVALQAAQELLRSGHGYTRVRVVDATTLLVS